MKLWLLVDPLYYWLTRLTYIGRYRKHPSNIFRVRLTRYKGKEVMLEDGTLIKKNDILVKIHLHNVRLINDFFHVKNDVKKAFYIYNVVKESLPGLATYVLTHKRSAEIKGIIGITTLNKGTKRLGFESVSIQNIFYKCIKMTTFLPIHLLSLSHPNFHNVVKQPIPKYIFMSKSRLISMYVRPPKPIRNLQRRERDVSS